MPEDKYKMSQLLKKYAINLNNVQLNKLWQYHNLIQQRTQESCLTGIRDFNEIILKHYVDCFIVQKLITIPFPLLIWLSKFTLIHGQLILAATCSI